MIKVGRRDVGADLGLHVKMSMEWCFRHATSSLSFRAELSRTSPLDTTTGDLESDTPNRRHDPYGLNHSNLQARHRRCANTIESIESDQHRL